MESYLVEEAGIPGEDPKPDKKKKHHTGYEFEGENGFAEFGGYMDAKISKLDQQYAASKDLALKESDLFAGISIFVNGLTNPSSGELKLLMMRHGGIYHTYLRSHTKFIIASNLPDVKIRNHSASKTIIKPEWISQCLAENKIVDYSPYLLVTNRNHQQPKLTFQGEDERTIPKVGGSADLLASGLENINRTLRNDSSLLQDKRPAEVASKNQARTANDPNFLTEFYNNSRLHHISTLGATFKQFISDLRENHTGEFPERQTLLNNIPARLSDIVDHQTIMHIDMDCFFVSVGLRDRPELIGQPVAVTHSKGNSVKVRPGADLNYEFKAFQERFGEKFGATSTDKMISDSGSIDRTQSLSEIASCSYEARAKGLKNGMFVGAALKMCPDLKTIPYDFEGYKEVAFTLYNTIAQYTLDIEAVSCDEMYVDLSSLLRSTAIPVMDFVTYVRNEIKSKTGCPCSAGIGANRIQARMATKKAKPNGQFHLPSEDVLGYFQSIDITDLPGVGRSTTVKLEKRLWKTCGDLQQVPISLLQQEFGKKFGETLHQLACGKDDKPLNFGQTRKSVSAEVNYGIRFKESVELEAFLSKLCQEVHNRLVEARRKGKCVTLKYMVRTPDAPVETAKFMGHGVCDVVNKSHNLMEFTADVEVIRRAVLQLNRELNISPEELRGIGIQMTKLDGQAGEVKADPKDSKLMEMFSKVQQKQQLKEGTSGGVELRKIEIPPASVITTSPSKKVKSPAKRGRPKKRMKNVKTKNITELLRPSVDDVDQDVLNELPQEFREDAVRSHRVLMKRFNSETKIDIPTKKINEEQNKPVEVDEDFLAALPPEIRREVEIEMGLKRSAEEESSKFNEKQKIPEPPVVSADNIFLQSNWRDVLEAWMSSSEEPEQFDVSVITGFWKELVAASRFEEVYSHFRYFYRTINSSSECVWHRTYSVIAKEIQSSMIAVFNRKLAIHDKVDCNNCD